MKDLFAAGLLEKFIVPFLCSAMFFVLGFTFGHCRGIRRGFNIGWFEASKGYGIELPNSCFQKGADSDE